MFAQVIPTLLDLRDSTHTYILPYSVGAMYKVCQGYGGTTHYGDSFYAIDFEMPIGTQVCAARGGVVRRVEDRFPAGRLDPEFVDKCNFIFIEHPDGSIAVYAHLDFHGVKVELNSEVQAGHLIGLSGTSGFSSFPHLHFHVCTKAGRIPTKFYVGRELNKEFLRAGAFYKRYK